MNSNLNSISVFQMLSKWKWHLIIVAVTTGILSALFSGPFFITPKYKSSATVYPSFLYPFSSETSTEQMLQIFKSTEIRDNIIKTFNLYTHYGIDTSKVKTHRTLVNETYNDNVEIKQTEFESVEINVLDKNPNTAARIVDSICAFMNYKVRSIQHRQSYEVFKIYEKEYRTKRHSMDSMEVLLKEYKQNYGLLDVRIQTKEYTKSFLKTHSAESKKMLDVLAEKGGEFFALSENLYRERGNYNDIKIKYEEAIKDSGKVLTYTNIVSKPVASDKKAYPVRWLIVLISVVGVTIISFLLLLVFKNSYQLKA